MSSQTISLMLLSLEYQEFYERRKGLLSQEAEIEVERGGDIIHFITTWKKIEEDSMLGLINLTTKYYPEFKFIDKSYDSVFVDALIAKILDVTLLVCNAVDCSEKNIHPSINTPGTWKMWQAIKTSNEEKEKHFPSPQIIAPGKNEEEIKSFFMQLIETKNKQFIDVFQDVFFKHLPQFTSIESDWWGIYYIGMKHASIYWFNNVITMIALNQVGMTADWYLKGEDIYLSELQMRNSLQI